MIHIIVLILGLVTGQPDQPGGFQIAVVPTIEECETKAALLNNAARSLKPGEGATAKCVTFDIKVVGMKA